MNGRLQDRHALLTGAGGGIGLAVTEAYLAHGARCTVVDMASNAPAALAPLLKTHAAHLQYVSADITQPGQIETLLDAAERRFGVPTVLFNNAAVFDLAPLLDADEAMYD
ncbi:MAG: SDR family NAD(P)-dependent oxidoreductase, partial [Rhodoferax sp.]